MRNKFLLVLAAWLVAIASLFFRTGTANAAVDHLLISEVYYDTVGVAGDEEWVEIFNPLTTAVSLTGYKLGDEETEGGGEGMYLFPDGGAIGAGEKLVIASSAVGFYRLYGRYPDFEMKNSDDEINDFSETSDMVKYSSWANGSFSLTNSGDEVLLLDSADDIVDAVIYEAGILDGHIAHEGAEKSNSLERTDMEVDSDDCSLDFNEKMAPSPGYTWIYEAENMAHKIGTEEIEIEAEGGAYWQSIPGDGADYLSYGPYTAEQSPGMYQVNFRLKTSDNSGSGNVARIEAYNHDGNGQLISREIKGTDFESSNEWQNFGLFFQRIDEGSLEYRVWFDNLTEIGFDNVMVVPVEKIVLEAENLHHNSGNLMIDTGAINYQSWTADGFSENGHLIFGPYQELEFGNYEMNFVAKVDNNLGTSPMLILDVINNSEGDDIKMVELKAVDWNEVDNYQSFKLDFSHRNSGLLEYRAYLEGSETVTIDQIIITRKDSVSYEVERMPGFGDVVADEAASAGQYRLARAGIDPAGFMVFGPYTADQGLGDYQLTFKMAVGDNDIGQPVAHINAYNFGGSGDEVTEEILGTDFATPDEWQDFVLDFNRTNDGVMEYRVYFTGEADLKVDYVEVK